MELSHKRGLLKKNTAEYVAEISSLQHTTCCNILKKKNGKKMWPDNGYLEQSSALVSHIINLYIRSLCADSEVREMSRTDPWRSIWSVGKAEGSVFGKPSCELTEQQKALASWSRIYDSVNESSESPPEEVVKDDDMLDGWLISQHREAEDNKKKKGADEQSSGVKGNEVFIFADSPKDASRIYSMNDAQGKSIVKQREKQVEKHKKVKVEEFLDSKLEMQQQSIEQFKNRPK